MLNSLALFIEREAGHVTIALILIAAGYFLWLGKFPKAEDLTMFALGVLSRSMIGRSTGNGGQKGAAE